MIETINERRRVAKKPHVCWECKKEIKVGETYFRGVYKDDGVLTVEMAHIDCREAAIKLLTDRGYNEEDGMEALCYADILPDELKGYPAVLRRLGWHPVNGVWQK